jgi:hypothetical protein
MRVLLSWSGDRSKMVAEALRDWIPDVIQACTPWLSSYDIVPGTRWGSELAEQLQQTRFGIICLTPENLDAPWILFEAGALSKLISDTNVCPYLLGLEPNDIKGPLVQFQQTKADKLGTKNLLLAINNALSENALERERFNKIFELLWPNLEKSFTDIQNISSERVKPKRTSGDLLEEVLSTVRMQSDVIIKLKSTIDDLVKYEASNDEIFRKDYKNKIIGELIDFEDKFRAIHK